MRSLLLFGLNYISALYLLLMDFGFSIFLEDQFNLAVLNSIVTKNAQGEFWTKIQS